MALDVSFADGILSTATPTDNSLTLTPSTARFALDGCSSSSDDVVVGGRCDHDAGCLAQQACAQPGGAAGLGRNRAGDA